MAQVIIWTIIFFGGDLVAVIVLLALAIKKDREKSAAGIHDEPETE